MKKSLLILLASAGFALAGGSESCGDRKIHSVPDAGSTLGLLSLGCVTLVTLRRRLG
jgi:hypothetical protein